MLQHAAKPAGMGGGENRRWRDQDFRGDQTCWLQPKLAAAPALQTCIDALMQLQSGKGVPTQGELCLQ